MKFASYAAGRALHESDIRQRRRPIPVRQDRLGLMALQGIVPANLGHHAQHGGLALARPLKRKHFNRAVNDPVDLWMNQCAKGIEIATPDRVAKSANKIARGSSIHSLTPK
jgi:hypothetical protein